MLRFSVAKFLLHLHITYVYAFKIPTTLDFSCSVLKCACSMSNYILWNTFSPVSPSDAWCGILEQGQATLACGPGRHHPFVYGLQA